jgi:hypothetical protein
MSGLYGTLACLGDDGLSYGTVEPMPDLSAWRARRLLSAPWIAKPQPTSHADTRFFGTLEDATAWLRDVPLPPHPRDLVPGAEILPEGVVLLPVGRIAERRIAHLLLHPPTQVLLSAQHAIAVPHLSPADRPGALLDGGRVRLVWHTPRGQRRILPRTRVGSPTQRSGWRWYDTTDDVRLSVLLARHLHGLAPDEDGQTAHQRIHIASMAAEIDAMLQATPWPEGAERALPIALPGH